MKRRYQLGLRREASQKTRTRILRAARRLLVKKHGSPTFSIDAVARQAGVTRVTVYAQFGSKAGLLEALFDDIGSRGHMRRLAAVLQERDPLKALALYFAIFRQFWATERLVIRRVRALGALDADVAKALHQRDGWRRKALETLVERWAKQHELTEGIDNAAERLLMLASFESYDLLAGSARSPEAVALLQQPLIDAALGWPAQKRVRALRTGELK
jgi:AcrR family transcriptional regulator